MGLSQRNRMLKVKDLLQFEHLKKFLFDQFSHFPKFDVFFQDQEYKKYSRFARVRGLPSAEVVGEEVDRNELLRTRFFKTVSLKELVEFLPRVGRISKEEHPDKKGLLSVQDFFRYTEAEGMSSISTSVLFD